MIPYYLMVLIPLIVYLIGKYNKKDYSKVSIILFFLILIFLLFLRKDTVGIDLKSYLYIYNQISKLSYYSLLKYSTKGEILYYFLNKTIYLLHGNFKILIIISTLLSLLPIMNLYKKEIKNPILTISLFITIAPFSMLFSGLRQIIAMGIVVFAFRYIRDKKLFKYIIFVFIAYFFHHSALFCLILYPVYYIKITNKYIYLILPLLLLTYLFKSQIYSPIMVFITRIFYESYNVMDNNGAFMLFASLVILIIYTFIFTDEKKQTNDYIGLRNFLILSAFLQCFSGLNGYITRINYYVLWFVPILIPKVKYTCKNGNIKLINIIEFLITIILLFKFYYGAYTSEDILQIFPYIPFWR